MKYVLMLLVVLMLSFTACADVELGHANHDHDGDGVQDHDAKDHLDEEHALEDELHNELEEAYEI